MYERLSDPDYAILAHGLLGHTPGLTTPPHLFGLNAQIESIIEIIDSLVSEFGRNLNVILVGHSVGSWFCLQVTLFGCFFLFEDPNRTHVNASH